MTNNASMPVNVSEYSTTSFTEVFSRGFTSSDIAVFWLIFVVGLLLLVLKAAKYILKWKNKKLSTTDTIAQLNSVLVEGMQLLSAQTTLPRSASVQNQRV